MADENGATRGTAADYLLASKRCDIRGLEELLRTGRLVVTVSHLVHALQRERGASNVYLASGGARFAHELPGLRADSDTWEADFRQRVAAIESASGGLPGASRLFSRIAYAIHGLDELPAARDAVDRQAVSQDSAVDGYSALIRGLLALVFEAADTAVDPDVSKRLVAMFHLMQGKECAGQERAVGAAGIARGDFGERLRERLSELIDNQDRCFEIFASFADERSLAEWRKAGAAEPSPAFERLRRIACTAGSDRAGDAGMADEWFHESSQRIDALKRVETQLERSLEELCARKLEAARDDLGSHEDEVQRLGDRRPEEPALAIFFAGSGAEPDGAAGPYTSDIAGARLGRSLVELVQSQSQRLQDMGEELQQARTALAERKTIEKAKGVIMDHRRMSEEEAYRFLREVAMAQSRRLADVATDTLNMADVFQGS